MPDEQDIFARYNEYTKHNRERFIFAPLRRALKWLQNASAWLNSHNGLVTALATVVIAWLTYSISTDSSRQGGVMQGQLDEMRKQREFTIDQLRASLKRDPILYQHVDQFGNTVPYSAQFAGWSFNPIWTNVGSTSAKNVVSWSSFYPETPAKRKDGRIVWRCPDVPNVTLNNESSVVVDKGGVLTEMAINVPATIIEHGVGPNPDDVLYLAGRIQYNDIFSDTPLHSFEWCVAAVPSNAVTGNFSFHRMYEREN